ncbi:MAG: response regulator [Bacteroidetes bacterium]|nr:response regulator [Bacteroidota bacterium]
MKKNAENKSTAEIIRQKAEELLKMKSEAKILELIEELAFQNEEKTKRAEELLIANKELAFQQDNLKKIASRVPGLVYQYLLRPDGTSCFPYASEAIREIYRVSPDEVREDASKVFANGHPDDLAGVVASIKESAQNLTPWQHEYRVKFDDDTIHSLYGNAIPQKEADGSVMWHGFITDITERKRVEDELRISEERYRLLAQNTRDVVYTMNLDGTITYVSPAVELLRGLTVEEAMNQPLDKILTPDSQVISIGYVQQLHAAFVTGLPLPDFHGELEYYRKDGSTLLTESFCYPVLENDGSSVSMIGVTRDITERKKAEIALLKAKEDAEVANKAKSTFLTNMSHEIRTPLNAIIGFSQLMNREKSLTNSQKEFVASINRAGEHLLKLINDILELSKMEAGRAVLNPTNFDLHAVLNDVQMMFKEQAQSKQLQLVIEASGDLPHHIITDDHKLRQILINLIGNAIKFTDKGGVTVNTRVYKGNDSKSRLIVEIQDSGPGMSEDELGKLFRQFEQTTAGIKKNSGTGLGLALSRELALLMGGDITVASEKGKGSVFTINVEIREGKPEVREAYISKRVTGIDNPNDVYRLLIVDDKEENRQVMGSFLRLAGFETNEAVNGADAITKFEEWNPHLILMDMRMPVMDGYEATRHIKSTEKGKQTPIIAVTASSHEDEKQKTSTLDIEGYIRKPFHESDLFDIIGKALGIEYVYKEETTSDTLSKYLNNNGIVEDDIAKLPEELVLQMMRAVESADFHLLTAHIKSIENDYPHLCSHLMTEATDFNYNYLLQILTIRKK